MECTIALCEAKGFTQNSLERKWVRLIFTQNSLKLKWVKGITGWAQVMYPYVSSSYEDMVKKLEYDLYYLKNMSFFLDCLILLKTIKIVLLGRGK